jgi:signal peptidase II
MMLGTRGARRRASFMRLTFWTGFWVFILDQFSKYVVVHGLDLVNRLQIDVWPPFITFRMAWNRGVNFGLFAGLDMRWVLIAVAIAISGIVLYWVRRDGGSRWTYISAGLLVGGALGNVVDRLLYGAVADFLNMSCCGIENPYAFNVADIAIFIGAVGLVFFAESKPKAGKPARKGK